MIRRLTLVGILAAATVTPAAAKIREKVVQACMCQGLVTEHKVKSGARADCISRTHAIEIDNVDGWAESIGQSLHYAEQTNRRAKVILFCNAEQRGCYRNQLRFESTVRNNSLPIEYDFVDESLVRERCPVG